MKNFLASLIRRRAVIFGGAAACVIALWWYSATPAPDLYWPATLEDCAYLLVMAVGLFVLALWGGGQSGGFYLPRGMPDGSENPRYLASGLALLAVVGLVLWRSHFDLLAAGGILVFLRRLPADFHQLSGGAALGLIVLSVFLVLGLWRTLNGWSGPFPRRGLRGFGGNIIWLIVWAFVGFVAVHYHERTPADHTGVLAVMAACVYAVVFNGVLLALVVGGGRRAGTVIETNTLRRNRAMRPGRG